MSEVKFVADQLREDWLSLSTEERLVKFYDLSREDAEDLFLALSAKEQVEILLDMHRGQRRSWIRLLPLDETADVIQNLPEEEKSNFLDLLDGETKREVLGLLAYAEDDAGGLMTPHFLRLRPNMEVEVAIRYLRAYSKQHDKKIYYTYVVDPDQKLIGVISFKNLLLASPYKQVKDLMNTEVISVLDTMDQEDVARVFSNRHLSAIPVVDSEGKLKGVVTYDEIADVLQREATEDIQKIGGMEALDAPYFHIGFFEMLKKRAGWLTILFLGEMFTATAMARYEQEIEKAVVLALFIPLIISSGGNSGSQASTLLIRSLALREVQLKDWFKVFSRELMAGLALGAILGVIGLFRIILWQQWHPIYGEHYMLVALTVSASLVGVVVWGTISGSMLPFVLRGLGFDPASASAPFVATLVDVTGLVIYFTTATLILNGTLL